MLRVVPKHACAALGYDRPMKAGPDISRVASSFGHPARANMLSALMGGEALSAGELAQEAGVMPQTASAHLSKLEEDGLLVRRRQGRHCYFALAGHEVAEAIEQLGEVAERAGHRRTRPGPRDPELRSARVCYDHLAGTAGVAMLDALLRQDRIRDEAGSLVLTDAGAAFARNWGVTVIRTSRRPMCKPCLDWSVRRNHLAGAFGAALLSRMFELGWARRSNGTRIVCFTEAGRRGFENLFAPLGGQ